MTNVEHHCRKARLIISETRVENPDHYRYCIKICDKGQEIAKTYIYSDQQIPLQDWQIES
jgi:hypothetical protein